MGAGLAISRAPAHRYKLSTVGEGALEGRAYTAPRPTPRAALPSPRQTSHDLRDELRRGVKGAAGPVQQSVRLSVARRRRPAQQGMRATCGHNWWRLSSVLCRRLPLMQASYASAALAARGRSTYAYPIGYEQRQGCSGSQT